MPTESSNRSAEQAQGAHSTHVELTEKRLTASAAAWIILAVFALAVAVAVILSRPKDPDLSADDLKNNSFAFGVVNPRSTELIKFAGSPVIDLAPTVSGTLHGQIRVPFAEVPDFSTTGKEEPAFLFALPRSAQVDTRIFTTSVYAGSESSFTSDGHWSCASKSDSYSGDIVALGKLYRDLIRIDCSYDEMVVVVIFPPGGLKADANAVEQYGSFTNLKWAPTVNFRVKDYRGIGKSSAKQSDYLISVDPNLFRDGNDSLAYDSLPSGLRPALGITPWTSEVSLASSTDPTIQLPHYGGFGTGSTALSEIENSERPVYLSGSLQARSTGVVAALRENSLLIFFLGLFTGQLHPAIRWVLIRTTRLTD